MKLTVVAMLMLLVPSCATIGVIDRDQVCAGWQQVQGTAADVDAISDRLALSVSAHNDYGEAIGCW